MIIPIIFLISLALFVLGGRLMDTNKSYSEQEQVGGLAAMIGVLVFGCALFGMALVLMPYFNAKTEATVIDDRISLVEVTNKQKIESITPVLEKYPSLEKEIIGGINPNAFAVLGDVYPELKSNESYNQQAKLILDNLEELKKLENEKIDLRKSITLAQYYLWFLN